MFRSDDGFTVPLAHRFASCRSPVSLRESKHGNMFHSTNRWYGTSTTGANVDHNHCSNEMAGSLGSYCDAAVVSAFSRSAIHVGPSGSCTVRRDGAPRCANVFGATAIANTAIAVTKMVRVWLRQRVITGV